MRNRSILFISVLALALFSAFLAYEPSRLAPLQAQLSRLIADAPQSPLNRLASVIGGLARETRNSAAERTAKSVPLARIVRVPAIREAQNYGWIQLPRGTRVDLVEERREGFLIRFDENYIVVPRAAVNDGSVVLRERRGDSAS